MSCTLSAVVLTRNEERHLPACLASVAWADERLVVDSFSTDRTEELARSAGARFVQHAFTGFGDQRNWSFDYVPLKHPWAFARSILAPNCSDAPLSV